MGVGVPYERLEGSRVDHPGVCLINVRDATQLHRGHEFVFENLAHMLDALLAVVDRIQPRPADANGHGAERKGLEDVGASCEAAVDVDLEPLENFRTCLERDADVVRILSEMSCAGGSCTLWSSSSVSIAGCAVSRERPPWLLSRIPSAPYSTAFRASAAVWIPFRTIGSPPEAWRIHARSSQTNVESMYLAITRPRPPPFLSLVATAPLIAEAMFSAAIRSSASRFPGTGASTVTKIALMPSFLADRKRSFVFCLSELTYSWRKKGWSGRPEAMMSPSGYDALVDI